MYVGCGIGPVTSYGDSSAFDAITMNGCVIQSIDPGAWDGTDPVVRIVIRGTVPVNSNLWNF
jgi:hypothetical protein